MENSKIFPQKHARHEEAFFYGQNDKWIGCLWEISDMELDLKYQEQQKKGN